MTSSSETAIKVLKLKSSDNEIFEVEEKAALQSKTIQNIIEDGLDKDVIPLFNIESGILARIVDWLKKHASDEIKQEELKQFDDGFVDVEQDVLYDLLMASNYLSIDILLHQLVEKVASMIRGKKPEEIRKIFHIKNDFTPEEEEQIRKENGWAFE